MSERYVTYYEACAGSLLFQKNPKSQSDYIETIVYLEEKYPDLEIMYREWSDSTVEDGKIEKENWF